MRNLYLGMIAVSGVASAVGLRGELMDGGPVTKDGAAVTCRTYTAPDFPSPSLDLKTRMAISLIRVSSPVLKKGCSDCVLSDTIMQTYCESRGTDCDGLFGWNESYAWQRSKFIYQCPPNSGWFVSCSEWIRTDCCNDGQEGLPNPACSHPGASPCSTRSVPPRTN